MPLDVYSSIHHAVQILSMSSTLLMRTRYNMCSVVAEYHTVLVLRFIRLVLSFLVSHYPIFVADYFSFFLRVPDSR